MCMRVMCCATCSHWDRWSTKTSHLFRKSCDSHQCEIRALNEVPDDDNDDDDDDDKAIQEDPAAQKLFTTKMQN